MFETRLRYNTLELAERLKLSQFSDGHKRIFRQIYFKKFTQKVPLTLSAKIQGRNIPFFLKVLNICPNN